MKNKFNISIWIVSLLILPLWTGCDNDMDESSKIIPETGNYSGTPIPIQLSVKSTANFKGVQTRSEGQKMVFAQPLNKDYDTGYDVITTIQPVDDPQTRAGEEILATAQYRLLAYRGKITTANFAGKGDYVTNIDGQATAIGKQLYLPGGTYTFVCYSLNKNEEIAAFDSTKLVIPVNQGDDFMTCIQKDILVSEDESGEFTLNNVFIRQCAKVKVEVSTTGYADNTISACAVDILNMNDNQVDWNFADVTPVLPNKGKSGKASFGWTTLNDTLITSDSGIVLPISERTISVKFTSLTIGGETLDNSIIEIHDVTMVPTGNYKIELQLSRNYIPVGGYKWAKGNLYKQGKDFLIQATQTTYSNDPLGGGYFDWNTLEIGTGMYNTGDYSEANDPCTQILPAGLWRTPSLEEARALVAVSEWTTVDGKVGRWFGTAPNRIFLPASGVRVAKTPPVVQGEKITGIYSLKDGSQAPRYNSAISFDGYGAYAVDRLARTSGMQIRCVRK